MRLILLRTAGLFFLMPLVAARPSAWSSTAATSKLVAACVSSNIRKPSNAELVAKLMRNGPVLQFGVLNGSSMRTWRKAFGDVPMYGFDSFTGLPPEQKGELRSNRWQPGAFSATGFAQGAVGERERVELAVARVSAHVGKEDQHNAQSKIEMVPGFFNVSLTAALAARILAEAGPAMFIDVDVDLYSSAATVLQWVFEYGLAREGTIIRYDDWWTLPCASAHPQNKQVYLHLDAAARRNIISYGSEPKAHAEVAERHSIWFECACGPCSTADPHWPTTGFYPFFIVRHFNASHHGFDTNGKAFDRYMNKNYNCRKYGTHGYKGQTQVRLKWGK